MARQGLMISDARPLARKRDSINQVQRSLPARLNYFSKTYLIFHPAARRAPHTALIYITFLASLSCLSVENINALTKYYTDKARE